MPALTAVPYLRWLCENPSDPRSGMPVYVPPPLLAHLPLSLLAQVPCPISGHLSLSFPPMFHFLSSLKA